MRIHDQLNDTKQNITETAKSKVGRIFRDRLIEGRGGRGGGGCGGLATAFDLAAFRLFMIAPVTKSVNHSRTVASMRETGWEQQQHQEVRLRSDSTAEMPTSGDLKSGDSLFISSPPPRNPPGNLGHYIKSYMK